MKKIYVEDLLKACPEDMSLKLFAGRKGVRRRALLPEIQKVGLALTGRFDNLDPRKIQVLGRTEFSYLDTLAPKKRRQVVSDLFAKKAAAYLVTCGNTPTKEMAEAAEENGAPLITSAQETIRCIRGLVKTLEEMAAAEVHVHGVLVDVMGVGVLIMGESGIGKSECALELVVRGHRLVADDVVVVKRLGDGRLVGTGSELIRYHMEIRGLGILNVKELFGISSVKTKKTVELVVELVHWDDKVSYDRLGIDERTYPIAGMNLPYMRMPVTPGRNIAVIVEVAARNHALKAQGVNPAVELDRKLAGRLTGKMR
ncbi:MAG: HPr(Ser) kinase/phosphatase [Nitrospirae bacterium]|nr:HPr(Ser) kinase/phosphatase [Nitrospirota bacterium]